MKRMKKIVGILLAMVMVVAMAGMAFAESTDSTGTTESTNSEYSITINKGNSHIADDHTYVAYQVFAGTLSGDGSSGYTLSDITWGNGITKDGQDNLVRFGKQDGEASYENAAALAEALNEQNVKAFAAEVAGYLNLTTGTESENGVINLSEPGYYFVKDKNDTINGTGTDALTAYIMKVVGEETVNVKTDAPSITKKIGTVSNQDSYTANPNASNSTAKWNDANNASIGDTVYYKLSATIPDMSNFDGYTYVISDTLSGGLTLDQDSFVVKYFSSAENAESTEDEGTPLGKISTDDTAYYKVIVSPDNVSEGTATNITINFYNFKKLNGNDHVVVYYSATLNEKAVVGANGNPNEVSLKYSNNPNAEGNGEYNEDNDTPTGPVGETPKDTVITYTTEIEINKVDENGNALTEAEFELTGTTINTVLISKDTFTKDDNGTYYKLKDGTYTTTAPESSGVRYVEDENGTFMENEDGSYSAIVGDFNGTRYAEVSNSDLYESSDKYIRGTTNSVVNTKEENTEEVRVTAFVGEDGKLKFTGLAAGTYTLKEVTTPTGYNTIADKTVTITVTVPTEVETKQDTATWKFNNESSNIVEVVNKSGSTLPETGGIGTTIFYVVGTILVLGAALVLITKKRMSAQK